MTTLTTLSLIALYAVLFGIGASWTRSPISERAMARRAFTRFSSRRSVSTCARFAPGRKIAGHFIRVLLVHAISVFRSPKFETARDGNT